MGFGTGIGLNRTVLSLSIPLASEKAVESVYSRLVTITDERLCESLPIDVRTPFLILQETAVSLCRLEVLGVVVQCLAPTQ